MPRKVTAWACKYRCGYKVQTVKSRMVEHEKRCCHNPENRACVTCTNFCPWEDYAIIDPYRSYTIRGLGCSSLVDDLEHLRNNCPAWLPIGQKYTDGQTEGDRLLQEQIWEEESLKLAPKQEKMDCIFWVVLLFVG